MRTRAASSSLLALVAVAIPWIACGQPPAVETPKPEQVPPAEPAPPVEPAPVPTAEPSAASSAQLDPPKRTASGRPPILKMDPVEITDTFGSTPAAKLEIGGNDGAVFRIPENALIRATNVTFKLDSRGKNGGGLVGKIYRVTFVVPPSAEPSATATAGEPFELRLPAGNKKDANLAVGEIATDDKGREKIVWTVSAPKKIDDASGMVFFEIQSLRDAWLHVTTKTSTTAASDKKP